MAPIAEFCPPGNWIGMVLLRRLLELALEANGLTLFGRVGSQGALNDSAFLLQTTDPAAAVELIKSELARIQLLFFCQIAVLEDGAWHCVYPYSQVRMNWLLDSERHELASEKMLAAVEQKTKAFADATEKLVKENGEQGVQQ